MRALPILRALQAGIGIYMMAPFEFATASRIVFGEGVAGVIPSLAASWGRKVLLVTGRDPSRARSLRDALDGLGMDLSEMSMGSEPDVASIERGAMQAREFGGQVVIGWGGGSVLDAGKAIAALLTNDGELLDYLEIVGRGLSLEHPSAPYIAVPTTAGTGSEVTRNAVLAVPEQRIKVSLRHPYMLPRLAVVDPLLTRDMPPAVTASTGLDALTQCLEVFVGNGASPLTDAVCREGLVRARRLSEAWRDGTNHSARADMSVAALCGGLALANGKLGAVHGLAGPLGGMVSAPHGALCARLLVPVMSANIASLKRTHPAHPVLTRYDEAARLLTGTTNAKAMDGIRMLTDWCRLFDIPSLARQGLGEADFDELIAKALVASSMKGNPVVLEPSELRDVLLEAL